MQGHKNGLAALYLDRELAFGLRLAARQPSTLKNDVHLISTVDAYRGICALPPMDENTTVVGDTREDLYPITKSCGREEDAPCCGKPDTKASAEPCKDDRVNFRQATLLLMASWIVLVVLIFSYVQLHSDPSTPLRAVSQIVSVRIYNILGLP